MFRLREASAPAALLLLGVACTAPEPVPQEPPFRGTAFIDPDLIVASDPSTLRSLEYSGLDARRMFDRRADAFVLTDAYLFNATFESETVVEIQVNAEFGDVATAERHAAFYARAIGQLPAGLRTRVETVWIHRGDMPFGGGNDNILILDPVHAAADAWLGAQAADGAFVSDYARDHPGREDVAESFGP